MSNLVKRLMNTAQADTDLLAMNEEHGDDLSVAREVEFFLYARSAKRAELVASLINDFRYGCAEAVRSGDRHLIRVLVRMPITQPVLCSVSGFFTCLGAMYGVNYDGWESALQRPRATPKGRRTRRP